MALQAAHGSFLLCIHHEEHRQGDQSEPKNDEWLIHSLWSPAFAFHSLSVYFILLVAWLLQWIRSLFETHISSLSTELPLPTLRVLPLLKIPAWTLHNYVRAALCASPSSNIHNWIPSLLTTAKSRKVPYKLSIWPWRRRGKMHTEICSRNLMRNLLFKKDKLRESNNKWSCIQLCGRNATGSESWPVADFDSSSVEHFEFS